MQTDRAPERAAGVLIVEDDFLIAMQTESALTDAGITVVKQGASGEYDSKTQQKPILGFAFAEKGLIGDLSLEGSKIKKIKI